MFEKGYKMVKQALLLDFACIAVAGAVLYFTYNDLLPIWVQIAGALVAMVLLVLSFSTYRKGRKLMRQAAQQAEEDEADMDEADMDEADMDEADTDKPGQP